MEQGLGKFCRDVDKLSKELWRADQFKIDVPKEGDHLIVIKDGSAFMVRVVDIVRSTVEYTGVVSARVVSAPVSSDSASRVGMILSGSYADGESVWTNKKGEKYEDYRLFVSRIIKEKTFWRVTGCIRKVIKANNASISLAFTDPQAVPLFKQTCTFQDILRWSKSKRHYLSVFTTLMNAVLSLLAILHNQSIAAVLMAACSVICFFCLHVELSRLKNCREAFVSRKAKLDESYLALKQQVGDDELTETQKEQLRLILGRYGALLNDYINPHLSGLNAGWVVKLLNRIETVPARIVFYDIDQYRDGLDLPD